MACLLPGYESNGSAVDLLKPPADLLPPGIFRGGIDGLIQTANPRVDQGAANFRPPDPEEKDLIPITAEWRGNSDFTLVPAG
jgi:hypothetical protein